MILKGLLIFALFALSFAQDAPSISCNFTMAAGQYTCLFTISNPDGFDEFEGVEGTHIEGMSDLNVTAATRISGNSTIVPRIFCNLFPNLRTLTLQSMGVQSLTNNPFGSCTNLAWLRLWNNIISEIAADTFANNRGLTYLDLDRNRLTSLPLNVFQGLSSLSTLELRNNNFEGRLQGELNIIFLTFEGMFLVLIVRWNFSTAYWFTNFILKSLWPSDN